MFVLNTPESVGISSENVRQFYETLNKHNLSTHSVVLARGNTIFGETYYAPFHKEFKHRMYSVSKSFVSVAIGVAIEEGLLSLDDKFIKFFPEYDNGNLAPEMYDMTIENMLCMQTCNTDDHPWWFGTGTDDRCEVYFREYPKKIPGTTFCYDSPGSYMLGVIVEKVTGKTFLDYLKEKFLIKIGFSEDSYCLTCPGGYAFSDSAVLCSSRDLLTFARFVMNKGEWDGVRYMNKEYLENAISKKVSTDCEGIFGTGTYGYGYQIWKARHGFSFNGMGDQYAICCPEKDLILVINSDNQGNPMAKNYIEDAFYSIIYNNLGEPLPENEKAYNELKVFSENQKLFALSGNSRSDMADKISGKTYKLVENPMGVKWIRVDLNEKDGTFVYENAQGEKQIKFGFGYNEFFKFPEEGYADMIATVPEKGNMYDCACSAEWSDERKLLIAAQIIDKYFGRLRIGLSFNNDKVQVEMIKTAEAFLKEYSGTASGKRI